MPHDGIDPTTIQAGFKHGGVSPLAQGALMADTLPPPELIAHLDLGFYRLGINDEIIEASGSWRRVFGVDEAEMIGRPLTDYYVHVEEARAFRQRLIEERGVVGCDVLMKRADGAWFYAETYARALLDETGAYQGQEATIRNVTRTEVRSRIVESLPVGFFMAQVIEGKHIIAYCNATYASMFGFRSPEEAIAYDISKLYQNRADFEEFVRLMNESEDDSKTRLVAVRAVDDRRFTVEATVKWRRNEAGEVTERYGLVRDMLHDMPLRDLRNNLIDVLHTYTNNQILFAHNLKETIAFLGPGPFNVTRRPTSDQITQYLSGLMIELKNALKLMNDTLTERNVDDPVVEDLFELEDALDEMRDKDIAFQLDVWHKSARRASEESVRIRV